MIRAEQQPHQMRRHKPDEADRAGGSDCMRRSGPSLRGRCRCAGRRPARRARAPAIRCAPARSDCRANGNETSERSRETAEAADRVELLSDRSPISQNSMPRSCVSSPSAEQHAHDSAGARCDDDAGEQQPRAGSSRPRRARAQRPAEWSPSAPSVAAASIAEPAQAQQHGGQRGDGRAAGNAHDEGIRKRIAQQNLHQHACERQQRLRRRTRSARAADAARRSAYERVLGRRACRARAPPCSCRRCRS